MSNTSASGGPIVPTSTAPSYDDPFDDLLQTLVVGVVGLPGALVRPRWQAVVPKQPEPNVNWCAIGVVSVEDTAARAQIIHDPDEPIATSEFTTELMGDGSDFATNWEKVCVLVSMYGPNAWANIGFLNSGIRIPQNREALFHAHVGLIETGPRRMMAELVNEQFIRRVDMEIKLVRTIQRTYPIFNLISASGVTHWRSGGGSRDAADPFTTL